MIDTYLQQANRPTVTLWEDNAGGLMLVDTDRQWAYEVTGDNMFLQNSSALFVDEFYTEGERYPYTEAVEQWPETQLVAEYDGERVVLYPDKMGYAAKRYCGIAR